MRIMRAGFTLIELLIVVAIIGILAAIAIPNFRNAQLRAKVTRVIADEKAVATALEQYFLDWNTYVEDHDNDDRPKGLFRLTSPISYIASLPRDPFPGPFDDAVENLTFEFGSGRGGGSTGGSYSANAYIIISAGPNKREEVDGNDSFPRGTVWIFRYDMSNGASSDGDIIRMGGQWNTGFIIVDGRPATQAF